LGSLRLSIDAAGGKAGCVVRSGMLRSLRKH
jgi:hypothetical protein